MTFPSPRTGVVPIPTSPPRVAVPVRWRSLARELVAFGGVGALAFVVDAGGFNLLHATVLSDHVLTAKVISTLASIVVAWFGSRHVTYRDRPRRAALGEASLFVLANAGGLALAVGTLAVSHYVLGFTSPLADNLAGNVLGVALGTALRFVLYRSVVFRPQKGLLA